MPLRGPQGRMYSWCAVCKDDIPYRHRTLRIHLNRAHSLDFIPGCVDCAYYRSRWTDVRKHNIRQHSRDIDVSQGLEGVAWGLTVLDSSKAKPSYANTAESEICEYPLEEEKLSTKQQHVLSQAKSQEGEEQDTSFQASKTVKEEKVSSKRVKQGKGDSRRTRQKTQGKKTLRKVVSSSSQDSDDTLSSQDRTRTTPTPDVSKSRSRTRSASNSRSPAKGAQAAAAETCPPNRPSCPPVAQPRRTSPRLKSRRQITSSSSSSSESDDSSSSSQGDVGRPLQHSSPMSASLQIPVLRLRVAQRKTVPGSQFDHQAPVVRALVQGRGRLPLYDSSSRHLHLFTYRCSKRRQSCSTWTRQH